MRIMSYFDQFVGRLNPGPQRVYKLERCLFDSRQLVSTETYGDLVENTRRKVTTLVEDFIAD